MEAGNVLLLTFSGRREELKAVFDDQVDKMCYLIDKQLHLVQERHARESVVS